jgi:4-amino-4-deoxy-L-arabinose transferase-like glycosyltransferase
MNFPLGKTALLIGLLGSVWHFWLAASVSRTFSTTVDEIVHLTAGHAYNTTGDFHLQPENGNLPQRWAALPLLFQGIKLPPASSEATAPDVWQLGEQFFHHRGHDLPAMLAAGRAMNAVLSGLLCFTLFLLARHWFGPGAGLVALVLAVFSPTLLAHGGLITSDTAAALGFALATLTWCRLLQKISPARLFLAGGALGFLALSKYSVVLFVPVMLLTAVWQAWRWRDLRKTIALAGSGLLAALVAVGLIWTAYGFRYSAGPAVATPTRSFAQSWDAVLFVTPPNPPMVMADGRALENLNSRPGALQACVSWAREHRLLPEAYLYGFAFVAKHSRGRLAYFAGDYRLSGWWEFFPTAFAVKTTWPELTLMAISLLALATAPRTRRSVWLRRLAPLWLMLVVYGLFAVTSRLNIGHRHLLPFYALAYVGAAGAMLLVQRNRWWSAGIAALLVWHVSVSFTIRPDYLAYFNAWAGGPAQAHRLFVDSSLDWGQDLPRLKQWLDENAREDRIYLSYFGSGSPVHTGIRATRIGDGYFDPAPRKALPQLTEGVYCVSATMLRRVYTHVRGPWSPSYEARYQQLTGWLRNLRTQPAGTPATDTDGSLLDRVTVNERFSTYEQLQFGRLCHFLELRPPDARAGYSILIYRLSAAEVRFALEAPLSVINAARSPSSPP